MSKITDMIKITKAGFSKDEKSNLSMSDEDLVTLINAGYLKDEIIKFDGPDESDETDEHDESDETDETDETDKNGIVEKLADKKAKKMFEKYKDDFHKKNQRKGADNKDLGDDSKIDDSFKDMIMNTLK